MYAIYVAQQKVLSDDLVLYRQAPVGQYLVKIGKASDLSGRMLTINGEDELRDWKYLGWSGWRFVRFREVHPGRLHVSELDSHDRFAKYKLGEEARKRLAEGRNTGFELFLGGEEMLDQLKSEFRQSAWGHGQLQDYQEFCVPDFHRTERPDLRGPFS